MQKKKVIIIRAGLGGLCTALRLCTEGYEVEIVEKYHQPGGRLNQFEKDGFTFDTGPSFFSMSYEFKELFDSCGIKNPLVLQELDPVYAVNFAHRPKPYLIYKDLKKLANEFVELEPDFEEKAERYLRSAAKVFNDTEYRIIKKNFPTLLSYFASMATVPVVHTPLLFRSMWKELEAYFDSEEVCIIFSLVAFFLGSTPFETPAVYKLLNYTELRHDGYWQVEGGMYKITEEIIKLLQERGVVIHYNTEITGCIKNRDGAIAAFTDAVGQEWKADLFVCNADAAAFRGQILKHQNFVEEKLNKKDWTLSPFTIYLGINDKVRNLAHHNYFLGDNFKAYASHIFKAGVSPQKPYYYVNVPSKSDNACAPAGCENIFILCPVPDLRHKPKWDDSEALAETIIRDLSNRVGFDLAAHEVTRTIWTPIDWEQKFNLYKGSGLGLAHGMNQIGGYRPANKDEKYNNMYYVGASTVPGTGLPIVVISSNLVTKRIIHDHPALS